LLAVTFVLFLITLFWPRRLHIAFSLVVALVALGAMGSFEFVREAIRKPFVISNYLYANSLYLNPAPGDGGFNIKAVGDVGVLKSAKWIEHHEITPENQLAVGHEIFRVECQSCHTADSYRGIKHYLILRQWDRSKVQAMLGGLDAMHNGVMPPFAGTDAEREALAAYISSIQPITPGASPAADGKTVYERNCIMCHQVKPTDQLFTNLAKDPKTAIDALKDLPSLFPLMPDLKLSEQERMQLVEYINQNRAAILASAPAQGGK
jgi:mono/diheme cytochrome c family protein